MNTNIKEELNVTAGLCLKLHFELFLTVCFTWRSVPHPPPPLQLIGPAWPLSMTYQTYPAPVITSDIIHPDCGCRPITGSRVRRRGRWADVVHVGGTPSLWQTCAPIRKAINFNFSCDLASHLRLLPHNGWLCSFCGWPSLSNRGLACNLQGSFF